MTKPRIAVLCGGPFAGYSLMKLGMEKFLCGIVIGSGNDKIANMFRSECERSELPFEHITGKDDVHLLAAWFEKVKPDAVFSICFPFRIPSQILLELPERFFNFHTGPLPAFRGPSPIFEVIRQQVSHTALTVHCMTDAYDEGDIVFEERIAIAPDETYISLANKMSNRCGYAAINMAEMLQFASRVPARKQTDTDAKFYGFPKNSDLTIHWNTMSAETISAVIRASGEWTKGAIAFWGDEQLRINQQVVEINHTNHAFTAGTIIKADPQTGYTVACLDGKQINITRFMSDYGELGFDYYRSIGLENGVCLT